MVPSFVLMFGFSFLSLFATFYTFLFTGSKLSSLAMVSFQKSCFLLTIDRSVQCEDLVALRFTEFCDIYHRIKFLHNKFSCITLRPVKPHLTHQAKAAYLHQITVATAKTRAAVISDLRRYWTLIPSTPATQDPFRRIKGRLVVMLKAVIGWLKRVHLSLVQFRLWRTGPASFTNLLCSWCIRGPFLTFLQTALTCRHAIL